MKVSLIIPHFNRADLLAAAIASVRAQSEANWEVIVVDDGSEAQQWERTRALAGPQIRVLQRRDGCKGPSRCRNLGLQAATGDYVLFLDSDDLLAPWCLEQRVQAAAERPDHDLWVFPVLLFTNQPGDLDLQWNVLENSRADLDRFLQSDPSWHTSSPLWRREKLFALGGFNEAVCYGDDADLHLRALLAGARIQKLSQALPDVFIRRSQEPRITNSLTPALIESRRIRLAEGTRALQAGLRTDGRTGVPPVPPGAPADETGTAPQPRQSDSDLFQLWEGQYFVEAEFLLFNVEHSRAAIDRVLADWERAFQPAWPCRVTVRAYFAVAVACRKHAYVFLRLARRFAKRLLPDTFFPQGGAFESEHTAPEVMETVHRELLQAGPAVLL